MGWTKASTVVLLLLLLLWRPSATFPWRKISFVLARLVPRYSAKSVEPSLVRPHPIKWPSRMSVSVMFFLPPKKNKTKNVVCLSCTVPTCFKNLPNRESESTQYWDFTLVLGELFGSEVAWHSVLYLTPSSKFSPMETVNFPHSETRNHVSFSRSSWGFEDWRAFPDSTVLSVFS